jgi:hypothetical protein
MEIGCPNRITIGQICASQVCWFLHILAPPNQRLILAQVATDPELSTMFCTFYERENSAQSTAMGWRLCFLLFQLFIHAKSATAMGGVMVLPSQGWTTRNSKPGKQSTHKGDSRDDGGHRGIDGW